MNDPVVKIGFLKMGCVGSAPLLEFLLDERAEREDFEIRVVGTGANMAKKQCEGAAKELIRYNPDLVVVVSPNASLPGPKIARETLTKNDILTIIISDSPAKKIIKSLDTSSVGYIIPEAESMIGARREFLDPVEMAIYNTDIIKVLAITGIFNLIVESLDRVIQSLKSEEKPNLPRLVVDKQKAMKASGLKNPYAISKAMAAHEIARQVAFLSNEGCFKIKEWKNYTTVVAAAHEMMRYAAKLADEAREIEKGGDSVFRQPHAKNGTVMLKTQLLKKPTRLVS